MKSTKAGTISKSKTRKPKSGKQSSDQKKSKSFLPTATKKSKSLTRESLRDEKGRFISQIKAAKLAAERAEERKRKRQAAERKRKREEKKKAEEEAKVKKPPALPKTPLPKIFGKNRKHILVPIGDEIRTRIIEAEELIAELQEQKRKEGKREAKPEDKSEIGYEYYQLIATIEKMSPHDIYTLFVSP